MSQDEPIAASSGGEKTITEDEAALYDRQIRLWGLEAQQRMRNATILIVRLRGVATEAIKNIVLAGIGKLIIVDEELVAGKDLGAGFLFRDEDVGKKRVHAAKPRVESLNPLVTVETLDSYSVLSDGEIDGLLRNVDLVCVTESSKGELVRLNEACHRMGKPFYGSGSYGLVGYIFCDLLQHNYITPDRSAPKEAPKSIKATLDYPTLEQALGHRWSSLTKRQTKQLNPAVVFSVLGLWEYESTRGQLPSDTSQTKDLEAIINGLLESADVNQQALSAVPYELVEALSTTAPHEFSPVCAVVGGILAQDILKALAAREAPIANFFTFDGTTGGASVCRMMTMS